MKVTYHVPDCTVENDYTDEMLKNNRQMLFLMNKRGSYLALPANNAVDESITNYQGWLSVIEKKDPVNNAPHSFTLYKSINNIKIDAVPDAITYRFSSIERDSHRTKEIFLLSGKALVYDVWNYTGFGNIELDFREIFDSDDKGRVYRIIQEISDVVIIEYVKYSDDTLQTVLHKRYLAIKGIHDFEFLNQWLHKHYSYDTERNSRADYYVHAGIRFFCHDHLRLVFGFGDTKDKALKNIYDTLLNLDKIVLSNDEHIKNLGHKAKIKQLCSDKIAMVYACSVHSLDQSMMNFYFADKKMIGLWAGLPWFSQFWSRDELISMHALVLEHRYEDAKSIILKYINEILADGRLSNRIPAANLGNADAVGWLFKRIYDFLMVLEQRGSFDAYFSLYDIKLIRDRLQFAIKHIQERHMQDGLVTNAALETWMDTGDLSHMDVRDGARIEIQAQFLLMLRLIQTIDRYLTNRFVKKSGVMVPVSTPDPLYANLESEMRERVRDKFLIKTNEGLLFLHDGYNGFNADICRPNIFLAYYIYPQLLSHEEWEAVFDSGIPRLWCEWNLDANTIGGGFATIDKGNYLYRGNYTGQDNQSYHRGDSWFFVNHIAALSFLELNKLKYASYIDKIMHASIADVLSYGFLGTSAELTSSAVFNPVGCLDQTWSFATFIELIHAKYIE